MAGPHGTGILKFLRNRQTVFQGRGAVLFFLRSTYQYVTVLPYQFTCHLVYCLSPHLDCKP